MTSLANFCSSLHTSHCLTPSCCDHELRRAALDEDEASGLLSQGATTSAQVFVKAGDRETSPVGSTCLPLPFVSEYAASSDRLEGWRTCSAVVGTAS